MSTIGSINLSALENAMEHELDPQNFQFWYNELIDLELEGNETPEVLETIFRGLKWILVYEHTNAEELKEIAEKEAVDMAEKEENWEQEKELLKEELSSLRERITSKAGMDDMNEAFRAEIDSLKAESNHLKQQLRERDRELADQRDKNEDLSAKYENAEKERTMLLTNLELEGNETPEVLETIFRGLKWILVYEHTNAEELKEIAEKEAVDMAEKEENWEQEKELLKEELSSLRERITSKAGMDDMNEAFRAEIDSLKAESNHLKQQLRERDRELADQRDKNEDLSAKYENAEKERTMLLTNQSQLEDTIREMNRRIITKTDVSKNDWEARKLKQRSEQAITLSNQLQNAINQNDHLQIEVDRLSKALEQATNLIKETTEKYASIQEELTNSEKTVEKLLEDNSTLKKQFLKKQTSFNEKEEIFQMNSKEFDDLIKQKDSQIEKYRENLQKLQMENENQRERLNLINDEEKEAELERLRKELIEATKLAKQLFGSMSGGGGSDEKMIGQNIDPTSELRLRILQLNKELEITEGKLAKLKEENEKLEKIAIEKDEINSKISGELNRLRKVIFGDADDEIKNLEQQIGFRDEQIKELTTKCSLLQIELERYVGVEVSSPRKMKNEEKHVNKVGKVDKTGKKDLDEKGGRKDVSKEEKPVIPPSKTMESEISSSSESIEEVSKSPILPKKEMTEKYLNDVEASAMIISSLNYELMKVMKVIFGDADDEIKNLEQQIGFRDEQIKELTTKCSLLQIELERYVGVEVSSPRKTKNEEKHVSKVGKVDKTGKKDLDEKGRRKDVSKEEKPVIPPSKTMESEISSSSESFEEVPKSPVLPKKEMTEKYLNDVEASAMIISSLNYELMKVMKENEDKERLLKEMEKTVRDHSKDLQLSRAKISQLMKNYAELKTEKMISLDSGIIDQEEQAKLRKMEEMEIKIIELERLAETIKQTGPELHRRMEEATRKLIYVQIKNAEYERKAENSNRMKKSAIEMVEKMKEKLRTVLIGESRQIQELVRDYELNMIEIARLQNQLIHSVPINQYDKILKKYKMLAQKTGLNVDYDEKTDPVC
uniref:Uncharacterized protein n=1 Tax=Panagrolaimus sp. JU765 TaxID=591449 RepID=A0AC34R4D8_9BILA